MKVLGKEINEIEILKKINRPVKYSFVRKQIEKYLIQNPKMLDIISSGKIPRKFVKEIRKILHQAVGAYQIFKNRRYKLLRKGLYDKILKTNKSTKERGYGLLYEEIFSITGKPLRILDLGAGINPVSLYKYPEIEITALEINKEDVDFLNEYFKMIGHGKAELFDIANIEKLKNFKADIGFMFKVVDLLDFNKGHKNAEEVVANTNVRWLVVSFATKTLSGKDMNFPYRGWFDRMIERNNWTYKRLIKPNEIFYLIKLRK